MIKVQIKRNNKYITQIKIKGQAQFGEYGKDLVCAGVKNGNIMIDVYENDEIMQVILETLVISLESFTEDYHQYIKITYEEE